MSTSTLLEIGIGGRAIRTTAEHPFWVKDRGWIAAQHIQAGDELWTRDGRWLAVDSLQVLIGSATVYNVEIEGYHTYFVGDVGWGFSVWAHNQPKQCGTGQASREPDAPNNVPKYVFDANANRYRDTTSGQFVAARNLPWPPNGGFASSARQTIQPGTMLDRFGSPSGRFFGEPGSTVAQRGMAAGADAMPYTRYRVLKPFDAQVGPAAGVPEFGAPGGATQYLSGNNAQWLLDNGFIEVVK